MAGGGGICSGPSCLSLVDFQRAGLEYGLRDSFVTAQQPTCFSLKEHDEGEPREVGGGFPKASEVLRC